MTNQTPMDLMTALRVISDVHTVDDEHVGYLLHFGARPAPGMVEFYKEAWAVIRAQLATSRVEPETGNFIKVTWAKGEKAAHLQMYLDGAPGNWIVYSLEQLDDLIDLLQNSRSELAKKLTANQ